MVELPLAGKCAGRRSPQQVAHLDALLESSRDADPAAMAEALRRRLAANEDKIREHIAPLEDA